jgi:enamine deaminase RidA (YjgF/YER057c/UK114 family)
MSPPSKNETFNPEGHSTFSAAYSHISRVPISPTSTLVSFAGQIGRDSSNYIPSTFAEQCSLAFENVDKCLAAVGGTKADIIQVRQYIVNLLNDGKGQDPERAKRYAEWMGGLKPPSTVLGITALAHKDLFYEIEIIAVVQN